MFNKPRKTVLQINNLRCFSFCSGRFARYFISNDQFFGSAGDNINAQRLVNHHQLRLSFCAWLILGFEDMFQAEAGFRHWFSRMGFEEIHIGIY